MNNRTYVFIMVMVMALVNLSMRAAPFVIFRSSSKMPDWLTYLSKVLPPAIMAFLVVYCLKNISFTSGTYAIPEMIAVVIAAVTYLKKNNALLSIGISTVVYMILIQNFF